MMNNPTAPLVSVCIPTYQHAKYIEQCLDSVLRQKTDFPFEIIIGEDNSTDGTREICQRYAQQHSGTIRLFLRKEEDKVIINGKKTGRYNIIQNFKEARGKYIAMLDGDDYWCNDYKLQKQVDFLEAHPDHAICFHPTFKNRKGVEENFIGPFKNWKTERSLTITDLAAGEYFILTCSCMFRNGMYSSLPDWFWQIPFIDYALHIWNAQFGKVGFIPYPMAFYRMHDESMWSTKPSDFRVRMQIELLHLMIPNFSGEVQTALLKQQYRLYNKLLPSLLKNKERESLQKLVTQSAVYGNNFQPDWISENMLKLHQQLHQNKLFRVAQFIKKARRVVARRLSF